MNFKQTQTTDFHNSFPPCLVGETLFYLIFSGSTQRPLSEPVLFDWQPHLLCHILDLCSLECREEIVQVIELLICSPSSALGVFLSVTLH